MKESVLFLFALLLFHTSIHAQKNSQTPTSKAPVLLTADSLASGNYKDVLSSFYQLAVKDLTGPNKELHFASNPFALMLKHNPALAEDNNYRKSINTFLRRLNFDFDAKLDSAYHFNGFSLGIKYDLLNKRDYTISKAFDILAHDDPNDLNYSALLRSTYKYIVKLYRDKIVNNNKVKDSVQNAIKTSIKLKDSLSLLRDSFSCMKSPCTTINSINRSLNLLNSSIEFGKQFLDSFPQSDSNLINAREFLFNQFNSATNDSTFTFDKLDSKFRDLIKKVAKDSGYTFFDSALVKNPHLSIYSERNKDFRTLISTFQNKPLWTLGMNDTSYINGQLFKSILISTEFLKGIIHPYRNGNIDSLSMANLELDIKAYTNFTDDTLKAGRDFNRLIFNFEPGINLVLKGKKTHQSYAEFKVSGSYINVWKGNLYPNEKHITNTINGTLRIRVFDEVWIPIEVKYDTKNHNVFGFLNVTTNFTGLGNMFKSQKPKM